MQCFFVSDLHGSKPRYRALFECIVRERPDVVLFGGDLLPGAREILGRDSEEEPASPFFVFFENQLRALKDRLGERYPAFLTILGNDDPRSQDTHVQSLEKAGLIRYANQRWTELEDWSILGYSFVPPTPFLLKDWEKYDVSRYVDPGCTSPEEGFRSVPVEDSEIRFGTIAKDLQRLGEDRDWSQSILLFHAPPYQTDLDRAALDGQMIDHVPLDVHVGSIAIGRYIEQHQPLVSLHGHVHEAARLTGAWRCRIGRTHCFSAAHDGPELALVRFNPDKIDMASRELTPTSGH